MVAKGSRAWPARSVFVSNFTRLPVRVPLPSLSLFEGGGGRAGSIFAARRPVQRDKSLINAVDRLDVIKFPLVRGFRLRKRSPTAGETSFEGDPILLSTPLLSSPDFSRGRGGTTDPHRWIFSRRETALCGSDWFTNSCFPRSFIFAIVRIRRNWWESRIGEDRARENLQWFDDGLNESCDL